MELRSPNDRLLFLKEQWLTNRAAAFARINAMPMASTALKHTNILIDLARRQRKAPANVIHNPVK
jgi:hypothetical protein